MTHQTTHKNLPEANEIYKYMYFSHKAIYKDVHSSFILNSRKPENNPDVCVQKNG